LITYNFIGLLSNSSNLAHPQVTTLVQHYIIVSVFICVMTHYMRHGLRSVTATISTIKTPRNAAKTKRTASRIVIIAEITGDAIPRTRTASRIVIIAEMGTRYLGLGLKSSSYQSRTGLELAGLRPRF